MRHETVIIHGVTWKRIDAKSAKKAFNKNDDLLIFPCNIRADNSFSYGSDIKKGINAMDFNILVNAFTFYNCNSETGCYPKFFIKEC